jgi:hypothetical protein
VGEVRVRDARISLSRAGSSETRVVSIDQLTSITDPAHGGLRLVARGGYQGERFELDAELGAVLPFLRGAAPLPVAFRAAVFDSTVSGSGTLSSQSSGHEADVAVAVKGDDLMRTLSRVHRHFPLAVTAPTGPSAQFGASLTVEARPQTIALKDIRATLGPAPSPLVSLTGIIGDVDRFAGLDLHVAARGSVGQIAGLAGSFVPELDRLAGLAAMPIDVTGRIAGDGRALSASDLKLAAGSPATLRLAAAGRVDDLAGKPRLDLQVAATSDEISAAVDAIRGLDPMFAGLAVARLGPLAMSMRVRGPAARPSVDGLAVTAGHGEFIRATLRGHVRDPLAAAGIDVTAKLEGTELARVLTTLQARLPRLRELRPVDLGPYSIAAKVQGSGQRIAVGDLQLSAGRDDRVKVSATGRISDALAFSGLEVPITVSAADLRALSEVLGTPLPDVTPVNIAGTLTGATDGYKLERFAATAKGLDVSGDVGVHWTGGRVRIEAKAAARTIDLDKLIPAAPGSDRRPAAGRPARGPPAVKPPGSVFSDDPLPLELLRDLHGIFELSAARVLLGNGRRLENVAASGRIGDGRLDLKSFSTGLAGGRVAGSLEIDAGARTPAFSLTANARGVNLGDVLRSGIEGSMMTGGRTSADLRLLARGASIRALAGSLTGEVSAQVGEGRIANRLLDRLAGDTLRELLTSLNPVARKKEFSQLKCGVVRVWLKDGIATIPKSVAFETEETAVMASGSVDLRSEQLDLAVRPKARRGLRISFGQVAAQLVRVRGTLAEPYLGVDALGTARTAASVGAAVATAGLSFLAEQLVTEVTEVKDPCKAALAAKPSG